MDKPDMGESHPCTWEMQLTDVGGAGIREFCVAIMGWCSRNFPSPNSQASSLTTQSPQCLLSPPTAVCTDVHTKPDPTPALQKQAFKWHIFSPSKTDCP